MAMQSETGKPRATSTPLLPLPRSGGWPLVVAYRVNPTISELHGYKKMCSPSLPKSLFIERVPGHPATTCGVDNPHSTNT